MEFPGRLKVAGDGDRGIAAVVHILDGRLTVTRGDEDLGGWALSEVSVSHLGGDSFALTVEGDETVFVADDPVRFTDEGIAAIEAGRLPVGSGALGWLWSLLSRPVAVPAPVASGRQTVLTAFPPVTEPEEREQTDVTIDIAQAATEPEQREQTDATIDIAQAATEAPEAGRCGAKRSDGLSCRSLIVGLSGLCFSHDPDRAAERSAARRRRETPVKKPQPETVAPPLATRLILRLDEILDQVQSGEVPPDVASAIADLVQAVPAALAITDRRSASKQAEEPGRWPPTQQVSGSR